MFTDILVLIVASAAIIGNSLVCHIILHSKFVKKTTFNYLLFNLAILDVVTTILAVYKALVNGPLYHEDKGDGIMRVYNRSHDGAEIMCKIKQSFWIGARGTPAFLLVIAYERYKAITKPLSTRSKTFVKRKLKIGISLSWFWGLLSATLYMIPRSVAKEGCNSIIAEWFNNRTYTITTVMLGFFFPAVIMSVLYYKVIKAIKRNEQLGFQAAVQRARERARRKVIAIIITVTVLFYLFCGIPHLAYITISVFEFDPWDDSVQTLLYSINSFVNPTMYFIFLKPFRMGLMSIFKFKTANEPLPFTAVRNSRGIHGASYDNVTASNKDNNIELLNINFLNTV